MTQMPSRDASGAEAQEMLDAITSSLEEARARGASAAEASIGAGSGLEVSVRMGEVETVEHHRGKTLNVTVYFGTRKGYASTSDLRPAAVHETVEAACSIARHTSEDPFAGLADPSLLAADIPDLDLDHPWALEPEDAIRLAKECEDAARGVDARIRNSEGATVTTHRGFRGYGNTHGFLAGYFGTRHSIACSVIAQDASGMQRDFWYTVARERDALEAARSVGARAGGRAVRRLGAGPLSTRKTPVVFEARAATTLFSHFIGAVSGSSLYRKSSFLLDQIGKPVFADFIRVREEPHLPKALGSAPFDNDGVATRDRDLVSGGVLQGYVLSAYSARKLNMATTGNAGGVHNLIVEPGSEDLEGLLRRMDTGLLVTDLMGFGVNNVTGDYSRGASGYWVEGGVIVAPVEEITIAGNLKEMFRRIVAVGSDVETRGNIRTGSVLLEGLTVAGQAKEAAA